MSLNSNGFSKYFRRLNEEEKLSMLVSLKDSGKF
jgi:hypothetical protein